MPTKKKPCNTSRLQDVFEYSHGENPREYFPRQPRVGTKARATMVMAAQRRALRDACVVIPRSAKTSDALVSLAIKAGNARGFDVRSGQYYSSGAHPARRR